jgi:adenylate cyclase
MVLCTHTFLFADLCGYTEYTLRNGDDRSAELAVGFHGLVRNLALEEGCEVVKAIGDAVMVRATECGQAVALAQRVLKATARGQFPKVRIGVDTGPAVPCDGDWYGTTVNTASRVADAAAPGELLMTERARAAATGDVDVEIVDSGFRALKGLPDCSLHSALVGA